MNCKYIDNHIHGAFGVNFNYGTKDEIKSCLKELYKRNIAGICPTLTGETNEKIQKQLSIFKEIKLEQLNDPQDEAFVIGVHLEGSFLSKNKAGIQNAGVFKNCDINNYKELVGSFEDIVKIVTIAPENDIDLINYLNEKDIKTQAGHSTGTDLKNCVATTHHFNAMNPLHHRNPSITLKGLVNDNIYCEIIADLIHTSSDMLKLFLKAKPEDKVLLVSDSLPCSHYDKDIIFCSKKIGKTGKDALGILAGSVKTLDEICENLVEKNILNESQIKLCAFENQIKYLNLKNREIDILNR